MILANELVQHSPSQRAWGSSASISQVMRAGQTQHPPVTNAMRMPVVADEPVSFTRSSSLAVHALLQNSSWNAHAQRGGGAAGGAHAHTLCGCGG